MVTKPRVVLGPPAFALSKVMGLVRPPRKEGKPMGPRVVATFAETKEPAPPIAEVAVAVPTAGER